MPRRLARVASYRRALEAVADRISRSDGDVAGVGANALEQAPELVGRMLSVRVDASAVLVLVLDRVAVAARDRRGQSAVGAEGEHLGAVLHGDARSPVRRAVVDDEHVGARELVLQLLEHRGQVLLLVPGRHENEGVALLGHAVSVAPKGRSG